MGKGKSITLDLEGNEYLLTRTLDSQWTVWGDNYAEPYRCVMSSSGRGECDCPDFTLRRKQRRELCKHLRAIVGLAA